MQGTGIAFMRDYGIPSIAALLDRTREFEDHGVKRYDDTVLIGDEATLDGIDSPRSHAALRRLNRIHGHYDIPNDEYAYVLATTIVGPVRWIEAYGWRPLDPHELVAIARVTTRFGELMGITGLPTTYDGYLALLVDFERRHFAHTPASTRLAEASIRIAREVAPPPLRPLLRRVTIAVMDEPLREALGLPRQPRVVRPRGARRPAAARPAAPVRAAAADGVRHQPHDLSPRPPARGPRPPHDARPPSTPTTTTERATCLTAPASSSRSTRTSAPSPARSSTRRSCPFHEQWERDGIVDREVWRRAGERGLLCFDVDEDFGGPGIADFRYNMVLAEESARAGASGPGFAVHTDIIVPYISSLGTDEQKQRWLPGCVSGDLVTAIAMTEPGAGSDLQGIRTTAVDAGDHYVLNGSKTFISNGILADLVVVVCRTDPDAGHQGISLLVVERGMEGFERGRNLDKMGLHAQDTAELSFTDVHVPKENLLGAEGSGFVSLMENLPQERISIGCIAVAAIEHVLDLCLAYAKEREAFGKPIGKFQHNRFVLAEMATEAHIARVFINDCVLRLNAGEVDTALASMAKWWTTELQKRVVDAGVQLHGGYGYMNEYPISKAYTDSRIQTIYGGTTEIQKEIIGRMLGL